MAPQKTDRLPHIAIALLILYNLIFFLGKFAPALFGGVHVGLYDAIKASVGFFTLLELLGVIGAFVDLIVRYDFLGEKNLAMRRLRLLLTALLVISFVFKLFMNYVDSAYLPI
jgi:hypothetical protein